MTEENEKVVETLDNDYIQTINELKANSVSKDEYNKLLSESRKLVTQLANNQPVEVEQVDVVRPSTQELRNKLFSGDFKGNDIDYVTTALQLRQNLLEETGEDIFVAKNVRYSPGQDSYEAAERVAQVFADCLEYANGDNQAFMNELMRRTNDVNVPFRK